MTQYVEHEGQTHEFPDEATPEMISSALGLATPGTPAAPEEKPESKSDELNPENFLKFMKNPETINEMVGGFAGGPGMGLIGKGLVGAAKGVATPFINAAKNVEPYAKASEKASLAHSALEASPIAAGEKDALKEAEDAINKHLNIGSVHKVEAAPKIASRVKSIEDYWKNAYDQFKGKIKNLNVDMPEQVAKNYDLDMDAIKKAVQEGKLGDVMSGKVGMGEQGNPFLKGILEKAPSSDTRKASEFLDKYQDFKSARYDLMQDLKEAPTRAERAQIKNALDESGKIEASAQKALEEGLGEHASELKWLNRGYSEQVHPLRSNPIVKAARKGSLSPNLVDALSSNKPGMPLLRELIKQDPELLRNVVGQRYAKSAEEIFNPHAGMREYLNEMPDLSKLLEKHGAASENVEKEIAEHAGKKSISLQSKMQAEKEFSRIKRLKKKGAIRSRNIGIGIGGSLFPGFGAASLLRNLSNDEGD